MVSLWISDPEKPKTEPLSVIKRYGEPLRSTAGCIGITKYRDKVLVAVGDWDTKHIDLYSSSISLSNNSFDEIYSFDMDKVSRTNWTDPHWWSYQNINLFTFNGNELYLVGLGQNGNNEDIADLISYHSGSSWEAGLMVYYKIATSSESSVTVINTNGGMGQRGTMLCFRGVDNDFPINKTSTSESTGTSCTITELSTLANNCMIVNICGFYDGDLSDTSNYSSWANASLAGITEAFDATDTAGNGGGITAAYGVKAAAGAVSNTTVTTDSSSNVSSNCMIALAPAA